MAESQSSCQYSSVWGTRGEKWKPEDRLPDFSYAGYHAGEAAIPRDPKIRWDFKRDFGGVGDGKTDNTEAFLKAIRATGKGVLFVPAGTYIISDKISFGKSNFVLRGEGSGKTVLLFTRSLTDLFGNVPLSKGYSQYSFGPGLFNVNGKDLITPQNFLSEIIAPANRGERILKVASAGRFEVGQWIRVVESDGGGRSLIDALYDNLGSPAPAITGSRNIVRFLSRVESICQTRNGNTITLERPLPYDLRPEWQPEIHSFGPTNEEVGIEDLTFKFPWSPYPGHFKEKGYNGIFLNRLANCWVRNVDILNADFGIYLNETDFCTVTNVHFGVSEPRDTLAEAKGMNGHHGIDIGHGTENLVTHFRFDTKFVHDLSVDWFVLHSVFSDGSGIDLNMDHHRSANYSNLFTDIDCGECKRPFDSSGSTDHGTHAGAYATFWNIHGKPFLISTPDDDFGPVINLIGTFNARPNIPSHWLVESTSANRHICPIDLHTEMLNHRMH